MSGETDVVDVFFRPFVRALGNLVVTFAQAEAALLELTAEMLDGHEQAAHELLKASDHKEQVRRLIHSSGLEG